MTRPILPGAVIGVLGSGQLGRMFAMAARRMGYRVHTFSPETDTPTGQIADVEITASYDDLDAVRRFARDVDVTTFEFENIPARTVEVVSEYVAVRPGGLVLHTTQHRLREKNFLHANGFPVTPFHSVNSIESLREGLRILGVPAVLKTAGWGYDGKGQTRITSLTEAEAAYRALNGEEAVLEKFIDLECEVSVIAARGANNQTIDYGVIENVHSQHILDTSIAPANISTQLVTRATEIAHSILEQLQVVGVLCVEFFLARDGQLFVNELAPRPHNSGHLTIDACVTSQFEQQLRAVCGLPLGSTEQLRPAAMANLLGDLWDAGEPNWRAAAEFSNVKLHLYGKHAPHKSRKMGHITAHAATTDEALQLVCTARAALAQGEY